MNWAKNDEGHSYYREIVGDYCILKIEPWEHGYFVSVADKDDPEEVAVPIQYFYAFQDARALFTSLSRLIKRSQEQKS